MGFAVCSKCGARIRADRKRCFACGEELKPLYGTWREWIARRRRLQLVASGLVALLLLLTMTRLRPEVLAERSAPIEVEPLFVETTSPATEAVVPPVAPRASSPPSTEPASAPAWPGDPVALVREGNQAFGRGDFGSAVAAYQKALAVDSTNLEALNNAGQALLSLERAGDAIPLLGRAATLVPDRWSVRFNLARAYSENGQVTEAVEAYRQAAALSPSDYGTRYNLGLSLYRQGQFAAAVDELKKAIELAPDRAPFYLALAVSYERMERMADAVDAYMTYLDRAPDAPDASRIRAHVERLKGGMIPKS